jgi:hypothetical protein
VALFAASDADVKARLRLSSVPSSATDTAAIIDEAILGARLEFHRRLGQTRVNRLLAFAVVAAPSSDEEVLRALAAQTEVKLVRVQLLRELPNAFMDASGDLNKRWNEEAPFRERPRSDREREIVRLHEEIEQAMQMLARDEGESPGDERSVFTFDGTPEDPSEIPLPGDTMIPFRRRATAQD